MSKWVIRVAEEAVTGSLSQGCRVYWGSHGCMLDRGHAGPHWCDPCECTNHPDPDSGCVEGPPYYGPRTKFYGEDAPLRDRLRNWWLRTADWLKWPLTRRRIRRMFLQTGE